LQFDERRKEGIKQRKKRRKRQKEDKWKRRDRQTN
jgi:hypothetical protein